MVFAKIFALRQFKITENQTACSRLKQRSVIKFLVGKQRKSSENFRIISTEKHVFVKKCLQMG